MTTATDIPHGPIQLGYSLGGFLPQVALHRRGQVFYQQSSYWHVGVAVPFVLAAAVFCFLPLETYPKCVWAGFFLVGGICGALPYFVRNRFGQVIRIDPQRETLSIQDPAGERTIAWSQIVGLQLCRQDNPASSLQLNLIWREASGAIERRCLATHEVRRFIVGLARKYESLLPFKIIDETNQSQR
jgi:hypothetical protein